MQKIFKIINIKVLLFFLSMITIILIFWINRIIVDQLRTEAKIQVEYLAKSYSRAINSSNEEDIKFIMDILLPSINFPIIITSNNEISSGLNLAIDAIEGSDQYNSRAREMLKIMDKNFIPLDLVYKNEVWGKIHYSEPHVVNKLRWMPYMEISFWFVLIAIILWGIQIIRNNEKNSIYVGMARETAHQLGTPISSLMGWINLLKEENSNEIIDSIEEDVYHLSKISERFSKIGSKPNLIKINISQIITDIIIYMRSRLPQNSKIDIKYIGSKKNNIKGDSLLIRWAIENLIKNSIDAIEMDQGSINITLFRNNSNYIVDINDSGRGINRSDWKKIFTPGYSSKKRGWGLGLSLTQRIIEDIHKGSVRVHHSKLGSTTIRIEIPLIK